MCGQPSAPPEPVRDRFGFAVGISRCGCGFSYLNPQLTPEGYAAFYQGPYRTLIPESRTIEQDRFEHGKWLAAQMPEVRGGGYLLDAGGASGNVAAGWEAVRGWCWVGVVDPCVREASACAWRATLEELPALPIAFDVVMCAQTIDHCYDPVKALTNLCAATKPGGWLILDYVPCDEGRADVFQRSIVVKVDHPCYWTARSIKHACGRAGWTVTRQWKARTPKGHLKGLIVCQA